MQPLLHCLLLLMLLVTGSSAQSAAVPLVLPGGLAFDTGGNLYFAETGRNLVRRLSPAGVLTVVAGTGTQGFAGDGAPAIAALLDSPSAVAVDAAGNLFIADTHNHRIRRVAGDTGTITTYATAEFPVALTFDAAGELLYADAAKHQVIRVASSGGQSPVVGSGLQGSRGDGGPAQEATLDAPGGLAFDAAGNLFISDTHNGSVRRVDAVTGRISTVPFPHRLSLPRGLAVDASGDLYIAESGTHRVLRVDAVTGALTVLAGNGVQGFDVAQVAATELDSPRAVALSPTGAVTFADSANRRIRQVTSSGALATLAGVGAAPVNTQKSATSTVLAQADQLLTVGVTASAGRTPTGSVSVIDGGTMLGSAVLISGAASFPIGGLSSGSHTLQAVYGGDGTFAASTSLPLTLTVGVVAPADFTLAATGAGTSSVVAGAAGTFAFTLTPSGDPLASRVVLSVAGLPAGASPTFSPGFLPPPSGPSPFTLTVQTVVYTASNGWSGVILAGLIGAGLLSQRRRHRGLMLASVLLLGCGDRVNTGSTKAKAPVSYNLMVTATATGSGGGTLVHSVPVILTVN